MGFFAVSGMTLIAIIRGVWRAAGACPSIGGGTVESYPEDVADRSVSGSFLHNATVSLFDRHGFERFDTFANLILELQAAA